MGNYWNCLLEIMYLRPIYKSTTPTAFKMEFFVTLVNAVNKYYKEIHYRCCRGPRHSETSYYTKFKNKQP